MKQIIIGTGKIIKRVEFSTIFAVIIGVLGLIIPNLSKGDISAYFHFNSAEGIFLYVIIILVIIFAAVLIIQIVGNVLIIIGKNIKSNVELIEYIQKHNLPKYVSLEVLNHENTDLLKCYGTLITLELYYSKQTKINLLDEVNPNRRLMSWGAGSESEYVIIPRNNGRKILNIASLTGNGGFIFHFHNWQSSPNMVGRYHIIIEVNGLIDDIPIKPIIYDGDFMSENYITPIIPTIAYWEGENGKHIGEQTNIHGGEPATRVEFIKPDNKKKKK
jgi:hypothetical protein